MDPAEMAVSLFGVYGKARALENLNRLERLIDVAQGQAPADLLLENATVVNTLSGETMEGNIALVDGLVAGIGRWYREASEKRDLKGQYCLPGLIDAHVHVESTMVSVDQYAKAVVPRGTTALVADPHEIANVLGEEGIRYILDSSESIPLDVFVMIPSAVPATHLETSGASIGPAEISRLLQSPRVLGLAELMNFPGVLHKDPSVLWKVLVTQASGKAIDGHAPLLSGPPLNAYIAVGVRSDHESTRLDEAQEKLGAGCSIIIRQGSAAKNLADLLPLVKDGNYPNILLGTDDRHPEDLLYEGHMDYVLKEAVALGCDPVRAVQMATINTARHYGLKDRGAIAPGYRGDITVVKDLEEFEVTLVLKDGTVVAEEGKPLFEASLTPPPTARTINLGGFSRESLALPDPGGDVRVIQIVPDQIITGQFRVSPRREDGYILPDTERDILKIAVIERHRGSGNVGVGLVQGFGLKRGALASSYAHDSHNIIVVGVTDEDMAQAVYALGDMGGGLVAVDSGETKASLALPIAGMLSNKGIVEVTEDLRHLHQVARSMGSTLPGPFGTLSFLALPVIPELKITDKGLVDVNKFSVVSLV